MKLISQLELAGELGVSHRTVARRKKELALQVCHDTERDGRRLGFNKDQAVCIATMTKSVKPRLGEVVQKLNSFFKMLPMLAADMRSLAYEKQDFRFKEIEGETWFCLKDTCDILAIKNNRDVVKNLKVSGVVSIDTTSKGVDSIDGTSRGTKARHTQKMTFINEQNLYRVIFQSRKEEAVRFQDWVFEVVLPSIRKNGVFNSSQLN
jgi:prophage antirepressor-like protein